LQTKIFLASLAREKFKVKIPLQSLHTQSLILQMPIFHPVNTDFEGDKVYAYFHREEFVMFS